MVEEPAATPGATPATGEAQPSSEVETQLEALKAELAATRAEIRGLKGEAAQQSELENLQASLERAKRQRDRLLNPSLPEAEPTAEEILKQQLKEARQQLQALNANPDKEAAELRQKLLKAQRELELAQSVQASAALKQVRAVNAEIASLKASLQGATVAIKRQTGWATVEAIAAEVGAVQRELGSIQSTLALSRLQMGAVAFLLCWIAIASAEAFGLARSVYQRVADLPGIGLLAGDKAEAKSSALPATATPLKKGDKVAGYLVTSGFGSRVPPCAGCSSEHLGVDLGTPIGTPVYAPFAATVECKGGAGNPAGNYAVLKPKEAKAPEFLYLHLDGCQAGDAKPGQRVGTSGNTGVGTGAHLDVRQIESGNYVNPTREWVERIITGKMPAMTSGQPKEAADFIAQFEGFHERPYWDYQQYTWGYGTKAPGPTGSISQEQARAELRDRIAQDNATIDRVVKVPLTESQRVALLSFQFNTGALEGSELLARLNAGDIDGAATEFDRWVHADGQPLEGLRHRRAAEKALFLGQ